MKTVEIMKTQNVDKDIQYLNLAKDLLAQANAVVNEENFLERKIRDEIANSFRKCESADCEYTAYANAHACEVWFSKLTGVKNGTISMRDLI